MREAGRRFGSSSVQLQLVFKRPLHPFYPPSVQLVSPRFQGPILRCRGQGCQAAAGPSGLGARGTAPPAPCLLPLPRAPL